MEHPIGGLDAGLNRMNASATRRQRKLTAIARDRISPVSTVTVFTNMVAHQIFQGLILICNPEIGILNRYPISDCLQNRFGPGPFGFNPGNRFLQSILR